MFSALENTLSQHIVIKTGYRISTFAVHVYVLRDSFAFAMSSQLNVNLNILAASDWIRPLVAGRIKTLAAILFWTKTSVHVIYKIVYRRFCFAIEYKRTTRRRFLCIPQIFRYARSGLLVAANPCILWWYKTQSSNPLLAYQKWHP